MNELTLIEQRTINNVLVDGYYGSKEAWFTRFQIGSALEYDDPQNAITVIHKRHRERLDQFSRRCQIDTPSGRQEGFVYSIRGVLEICRWSMKKITPGQSSFSRLNQIVMIDMSICVNFLTQS